MANHPLIKDVEKWIVDSFSFMDGIGYDVEFDDEELKNTNIIVADIDGLTDSDFEKGKKNLLKSIPNKIKAEFPYLWIHSDNDGYYLIMYVVLADNDRFFKVKDIPYINLNESQKSARKSMKESINDDCYIYYDDDDGKRLVFCDYVKGITDTRDWFYLNEYIIDAIHIFKNEKQAQKFIDERLKYFADQDKVVIAEYPQTVSGFFESKESARKSLKEERYNVELSDYSGSIVDEETFDKKSDAIQWAKDNGRNCYARIWDNEEGKTVKEWKVKSIKEQFVGKGEGGYRKPDKTKFNSGICLDSNGVKHTVIFDTHIEDFIVWVDNDNYLMWYVSSPQSLLNNLSESDLDENLILDIVSLWEKLPKKRIKN